MQKRKRPTDGKRARKGQTLDRKRARAAKYAAQGRPTGRA